MNNQTTQDSVGARIAPTGELESPPSFSKNYHPVANPNRLRKYMFLKYAVDRIVAALLLLPATPVIFVLCCLVRATSRGSAIYRQTRVGLNGKTFSMYKIRTMFIDAESKGPQWSVGADPRVTRIGRFLRFLHLDELPQLLNVLKGEMSIIGPRPERPEFVRILSQKVDQYDVRHTVKPGITGLAQIYLPPDETIDCVRKKVCFDLAYIQSANPIVDFQIWLCTVVRILGVRRGKGPRWFRLDSKFHDVIRQCYHIGENASQEPIAQIEHTPPSRRPLPPKPKKQEFGGLQLPVATATDSVSDSTGQLLPRYPK